MTRWHRFGLGVVFGVAVLLSGCLTEPAWPDQPITLEFEDAGFTYIKVRVSIPDSITPRTFRLTRDDRTVTEALLVGPDTVLVDRGLTRNTTYTYRAMSLYRGDVNEQTTPLQVSTLDTTSHQFTWEIDTVGYIQTRLGGVWGTSPSDVYVAGFIRHEDRSLSTNIIHWDGARWRRMDYFKANIKDIYGFGANNLWLAGDIQVGADAYAVAAHWNGDTWHTWEMMQYNGLLALWGTDNSNVYAVGGAGTILHYNGHTWRQMAVDSEYSLYDVWGIDPHSIYAVGGDPSTGVGTLLHYDGQEWTVIYERDFISGTVSGMTSSLWGMSDTTLYLNTNTGEWYGGLGGWTLLPTPSDNTYIEYVRGSGPNNIFWIGHFGLIIHGNGNSWHRYDQFYRKPAGDKFKSLWAFEDAVFIVGRAEDSRGIIYRGYRSE